MVRVVHENRGISDLGIKMLRNPYPFRAMVAICSDLDETPSADTYFKTIKYLNSNKTTEFGTGVGLEVGNSMYFYMPKGEFSYFNSTESERSRIRELMRLGLIDCIHSFGDCALTREQAAFVLDHLSEKDCFLDVWIDHARAASNFGRDIMSGQGDLTDAAVYHADLTLDYGVQFVWLGRVTSIHGQDSKPTLDGTLDKRYPIGSTVTAAKECAKIFLGRMGLKKYAMHSSNKLIRSTSLRDGNEVLEFLRANPNPLGVSVGETAKGLPTAISESVLDRVVSRRSRMIVYTHLGKKICERHGFDSATRGALERLASRNSDGEILVTTTSRLLNYVAMQEGINWTARARKTHVEIEVSGAKDLRRLEGLTFEAPRDKECILKIQETGTTLDVKSQIVGSRRIISVPWTKLSDV